MENGRIPLAQLVYVGPDVDGEPAYLIAATARDWLALKAGCLAATGVELQISGDGGAYRTFEQQQQYWLAAQNGGPSAAAPGGSPHGLGKAVDVFNWADADPWLRDNSQRFGFFRDVRAEGWHHHHPSDTAVIPDPRIESEIDMTQLNYIALVDAAGRRIKYGIFGQTIPGGCEIVDPKDITTAQAYGDLAGTRIYRPDGMPLRVGAPLKDVQQAEWDALVVTSARLSRNYFAGLGAAIAEAVKA